MDPFLIDLPLPLRWLLVNVLIVPRRKSASSELYKNIWTPEGSPLLVHARTLVKRVELLLSQRPSSGSEWVVRYGSLVGNPSVRAAFEELSSVSEIAVFPMFPQETGSTWGSTRATVNRLVKELGVKATVRVVDPFYLAAPFVDKEAELLRTALGSEGIARLSSGQARVLFSFHGVPVSHLKRDHREGGPTYDDQCLTTARVIAGASGLTKQQRMKGK
jgi:ferrochelatase